MNNALPTVPTVPTVSIVIPVYNGKKTIRFCLDSIMQLDYPKERLEVIVVDNNSKDGTPDIVKQYPVKLMFEREKQGPHQATNTGLQEATGEIIAFTDSDCYVDRHWLRKLVEPFDDAGVVAVGGKIDVYTPESRVEKFLHQTVTLKNCVSLSDNFPISIITPNAAYRADVIREIGFFDEHLYTGAEVDLAWRAQWHTGKRVACAPEAIVYHKYGSSLRRLFRHHYIYGYSEIILGTMYKHIAGYPATPGKQLRLMLSQVRSLFTYALSIVVRFVKGLFTKHGEDFKDYIMWPVMWLLSESGSLYGKVQGLRHTRFYRRQFWMDGLRGI